MKKVINGELVEGTPDEILAYERALYAGRPPAYAPPVPALVDEVSSEERLREFGQKLPVTPTTAERYVAQLRLLQAHIHPRPLLSASTRDVAAVRDALLVKCSNLETTKPNTRIPGMHSCKAGLFERSWSARPGTTIPLTTRPGEKPEFCAPTCASYKFTPYRALTFLVATKRFFDFYDDLVPRNPAKKLLSDFFDEYEMDEYLEERYCPTAAEVRQLLDHARDLRARTILFLLAKTGRRLDEVRYLRWSDIDLDAGVIHLDRLRLERRQRAGRGRTKMKAVSFQAAFVDDELAHMLHDYRDHYWLPTVAKVDGKPVTDALWLDRTQAGVVKRGTIQGWVDAALRDAGMWDMHGEGGERRVSPHAFRHFFTTILQSGADPAPREFVKLLRGDVMGDAMQRYEHVPLRDLRETYIRHMPRLAS